MELEIDQGNQTIILTYTATGSTNSHLKLDSEGKIVIADPSDPDALPEMQFWEETLYLQPWAYAEDTAVSPQHPGVNLTWTTGGDIGGTLYGQFDVGDGLWGANPSMGDAVIQMRLSDGQGGLTYGPVREQISWRVTFNGQTAIGASLYVIEKPLPAEQNRLTVPLRIIDSSMGSGLVYLLGYPSHPGVARQPDDPNTPEDERILPAEPIPDWETRVKAIEK